MDTPMNHSALHQTNNGNDSNLDPNGEQATPDEDSVSQDSMRPMESTVNGGQAKTTQSLTSHGSTSQPEPHEEQATTSQASTSEASKSESTPNGEPPTTSQSSTSQASTSQQEPNGTNSVSPFRAEDVDLGLGEYITKQYGLLKQILSFLTCPRDICNAKLVNREWSIAASAVGHNPALLLCSTSKVKQDFEKPVLPKLILYQSPTIWDFVNKEKVCQCNLKYFICPCTASSDDTLFVTLLGPQHNPYVAPREDSNLKYFICPCTASSDDTLFVTLLGRQYNPNVALRPPPSRRLGPSGLSKYPDLNTYLEERIVVPETGYTFWKSIAMILPSSEKINVSKFSSGKNIFNQEITDALLNSCIGGEQPIKCLIVIAKASRSSKKNRWIDELVKKIIERQGKTFAFGGGDIEKYYAKLGEIKSEDHMWDPSAIVLITLRGKAVTADSAILTRFENQDVTKFMQEFSAQVGAHPERGATRLAFIAQCVDRERDEFINNHESKEFEKYFPLLPQFGFHAYGEYGMNSQRSAPAEPNGPSTSQGPSTKRIKLNDTGTTSSVNPPTQESTSAKLKYSYSGTTSFVILTFNLI